MSNVVQFDINLLLMPLLAIYLSFLKAFRIFFFFVSDENLSINILDVNVYYPTLQDWEESEAIRS